MHKEIFFIIVTLLLLTLSGCGYKNPVLTLSSDEFAERVNAFDRSMLKFNDGANNCGSVYAEAESSASIDKDWVQACHDYFVALKDALAKEKSLQSLTVEDLSQPATWKHYRASRLAKGKGIGW